MADKYKVAPEPNGDAPAAASDETKGEAKAMGERRPSVAFMNESVTNKGSVEIVEEEWSFEHVKLLYVDGEDDGARENARSAPAPKAALAPSKPVVKKKQTKVKQEESA